MHKLMTRNLVTKGHDAGRDKHHISDYHAPVGCIV